MKKKKVVSIATAEPRKRPAPEESAEGPCSLTELLSYIDWLIENNPCRYGCGWGEPEKCEHRFSLSAGWLRMQELMWWVSDERLSKTPAIVQRIIGKIKSKENALEKALEKIGKYIPKQRRAYLLANLKDSLTDLRNAQHPFLPDGFQMLIKEEFLLILRDLFIFLPIFESLPSDLSLSVQLSERPALPAASR